MPSFDPMLQLLLAELNREWTLLWRYATEAIAGIIGFTIAFYGLFLTTRYVAGPGLQLGDRLDSIVVGYVLWSLTVFIIGDIAGGLQREAMTGTLEQIFLTPFGASTVFVARAVANLAIQFAQNLIILIIIMAITGSRLSFPPVLLLPLVAVLLGAYGLALTIGSLALLLKRVQQLLAFIPFGLLIMLTVPMESWSGSYRFIGFLLPMSPAAEIMRDLMARGQTLSLGAFAIALFNGGTYFAMGLYLFRWAEREAKRRGKLAGY